MAKSGMVYYWVDQINEADNMRSNFIQLFIIFLYTQDHAGSLTFTLYSLFWGIRPCRYGLGQNLRTPKYLGVSPGQERFVSNATLWSIMPTLVYRGHSSAWNPPRSGIQAADGPLILGAVGVGIAFVFAETMVSNGWWGLNSGWWW